VTKAKNLHWGSTLDDFLEEDGIREEVTTAAIKRVVGRWLREIRERRGKEGEPLGNLHDED
jgi:antitoxin HicB